MQVALLSALTLCVLGLARMTEVMAYGTAVTLVPQQAPPAFASPQFSQPVLQPYAQSGPPGTPGTPGTPVGTPGTPVTYGPPGTPVTYGGVPAYSQPPFQPAQPYVPPKN